jgi:hypothetical protein
LYLVSYIFFFFPSIALALGQLNSSQTSSVLYTKKTLIKIQKIQFLPLLSYLSISITNIGIVARSSTTERKMNDVNQTRLDALKQPTLFNVHSSGLEA